MGTTFAILAMFYIMSQENECGTIFSLSVVVFKNQSITYTLLASLSPRPCSLALSATPSRGKGQPLFFWVDQSANLCVFLSPSPTRKYQNNCMYEEVYHKYSGRHIVLQMCTDLMHIMKMDHEK